MKVNELRIGNYVGFKNRTNCYCEVVDLSFDGGVHIIRHWTDGLGWPEYDQPEEIEDITGIPLTEEWLLKFGFVNGNKTYANAFSLEVLQTDFYLRPCYAGGYYWGFNLEKVDDCEFNDAEPVISIHQLQNLYFALTGEELTISERSKRQLN